MKIGVTGVRGLIGGRFAELARQQGHGIVGFSRAGGEGFRMFSQDRVPDLSHLDAVVHFAGEPVLGVWTRAKRERILNSRVLGTRRMVEGFTRSSSGPRIFVCASAVGYYGDTGEGEVSESSPSGSGFLADVARQWEEEAVKAAPFGVRVVRLRIGFVLGKKGSMALAVPIFRSGLGGAFGSGRQWMSVIHLDDVAGMALWAVGNPAAWGPINAVSPDPVRNQDFADGLARAVGRSPFLAVPAPVLRVALGGLSHLLLDSMRVKPAAAISSGYQFRFPSLASALSDCV